MAKMTSGMKKALRDLDLPEDRREAAIKPPRKGRRKKRAPKAETTAYQGGDKYKNY